MATDRDGTYEVGFGKPPKHARFQKGQSGNPRGRPKGSKNLTALLDEELNARVAVSENGKRKTITMRRAISKQTVRQAAAGKERFIKLVYEQDRLMSTRDAAAPSATAPIDEDDQRVLQDLLREFQTRAGTEDEEPG